jgi:hypothetical protein
MLLQTRRSGRPNTQGCDAPQTPLPVGKQTAEQGHAQCTRLTADTGCVCLRAAVKWGSTEQPALHAGQSLTRTLCGEWV